MRLRAEQWVNTISPMIFELIGESDAREGEAFIEYFHS